MSTLDQPMLIATTGYHVGHQRTIRIAEELGYFREEGLSDYEYDYRGLTPGPFERDGLGLIMQEHGVDIAAAANIESVVVQRGRGEDMFIVGGWRYNSGTKFFVAKGIENFGQLKGKRIGVRETGSMTSRAVVVALQRAGVNPEEDIEWVCDPVFAYGNSEDHLDMLRTGKVDGMSARRAWADKLAGEGYRMLIDGTSPEYAKRPGRVVVATRQTMEKRADELKGFLRAQIRAFWYCTDPDNFQDLYDRETRWRQQYTHNEDERQLRITTSRPNQPEQTIMPLDGQISHEGVEAIIQEMRELGELESPLELKDILRDEFVADAFAELRSRPACQPILKKLGVVG